ncbi:hypothetical protein Pint_21350 [Pistacia integerrima]|uniref:Uncharacterized protein n=1 Tax=Pistacia integerrima TaxID=434235 RepID=A0ACC0X8P2_9ROSI|nr:hypothetical protein Pint_21350 [Pistacia integerrima]
MIVSFGDCSPSLATHPLTSMSNGNVFNDVGITNSESVVLLWKKEKISILLDNVYYFFYF